MRTIQCRAVLFGYHGCRVIRNSLLLEREREVKHDDPARQHRNPIYVLSFQLFASLDDAPGRNANDDNIRSNLRTHEESVADMLHHARVDARREYPRSCGLGCFQEAAFEYLTEPWLQFEILYATMNTDNLDRRQTASFLRALPFRVVAHTRLGNCKRHCLVNRCAIWDGLVSYARRR